MSAGRPFAVGGLMLALAALDFAAALMAQDFADRRRIPTLLIGSALSISLFVVYAVALRLANLSIVTMGWIVMLQVAVIAFDVTRHGLHLRVTQWLAVGLVIVLQVFLTATTQTRSDLDRADNAGPLAGHEEHDPTGHRDGVVGEALVVATAQGDVDRRLERVTSLLGQQPGEQLSLVVVHHVVVALELERQRDVAAGDHTARLLDDLLGDLAHLEDGGAQLARDGVVGIAAARDLGNMEGVIAHALEVADHAQTGDQRPQVGGHRLLAGQQVKG